MALPRPLELEHGVHQVGVALEEDRVPAPDVGRAQDQAAVVVEEGGQARVVPICCAGGQCYVESESDVSYLEPIHRSVNTRGPHPARSVSLRLAWVQTQSCSLSQTSAGSGRPLNDGLVLLAAVAVLHIDQPLLLTPP